MAYNGKDILPVARSKLGQTYVLGARAPLMNPNWSGPWDCAEFTSWCAYQTYKIVFGVRPLDPRTADAFSGFWFDDANSNNVTVPVEQALATAGAFLIRTARPGLIGHVAICAGDGVLIEAAGAKLGVIERANTADRRWTTGCLLPGVRYEMGAAKTWLAAAEIYHVATPYMRGPQVRKIQQALKAKGIDPGPVDGIYAELTEAAVAAFQRLEGLVVDGEVGPETRRALGL